MPAPQTYTGEEVVEFSVHGNPLLVDAVLDAARAAGARPARPGEFTRQAVENGRLGLVQAEAVHALVEARSAEGIALAQASLGGALNAPLSALREVLLDAGAELEARLDQPGGELEVEADEAVSRRLRSVAQRAGALAATWDHARPRLKGAQVALVGPVNAGKSSLFNHLVGSERALVSPQPGTTRDGVERRIVVGNSRLEVTLVDTAGERAQPEALEASGLAIGRALAGEADLVVLVWPRSRSRDATLDLSSSAIPTHSGCTRSATIPTASMPRPHRGQPPGAGLPSLREALELRLAGAPTHAETVAVVSGRQAARLQTVSEHSTAAAEALLGWAGPAIAAEEVYAALEVLSALTGEDIREATLDRLFSRFCIGK